MRRDSRTTMLKKSKETMRKMNGKKSGAENAGEQLGNAIIEMIEEYICWD